MRAHFGHGKGHTNRHTSSSPKPRMISENIGLFYGFARYQPDKPFSLQFTRAHSTPPTSTITLAYQLNERCLSRDSLVMGISPWQCDRNQSRQSYENGTHYETRGNPE